MRCAQFGPKLAGVLALAWALTTTPGAWADSVYEVLHNFTGEADGGLPSFGMALDSTGSLYGVTIAGGPECKSKNYCGTVFQLTRLTGGRWEETVLHNFAAWGDGDGPNGGPAIDAKGNLYGAATAGPGGIAALYQMAPKAGGWNYRLIYDHGAGLSVLFDKENKHLRVPWPRRVWKRRGRGTDTRLQRLVLEDALQFLRPELRIRRRAACAPELGCRREPLRHNLFRGQWPA